MRISFLNLIHEEEQLYLNLLKESNDITLVLTQINLLNNSVVDQDFELAKFLMDDELFISKENAVSDFLINSIKYAFNIFIKFLIRIGTFFMKFFDATTSLDNTIRKTFNIKYKHLEKKINNLTPDKEEKFNTILSRSEIKKCMNKSTLLQFHIDIEKISNMYLSRALTQKTKKAIDNINETSNTTRFIISTELLTNLKKLNIFEKQGQFILESIPYQSGSMSSFKIQNINDIKEIISSFTENAWKNYKSTIPNKDIIGDLLHELRNKEKALLKTGDTEKNILLENINELKNEIIAIITIYKTFRNLCLELNNLNDNLINHCEYLLERI